MSSGQILPETAAVFQFGISELIAVVALLAALGSMAYTIRHNRSSRKDKMVEEYWFRLIISPKCIEPTIAALSEIWTLTLDLLAQDKASIKEYCVSFTKYISLIRTKNELIRILSTIQYTALMELLDKVEDEIINEAKMLIENPEILSDRQKTQITNRIWSAITSASAEYMKLMHKIQFSLSKYLGA